MSQPSLGPRTRLTCEPCKRRKVKCDKLRPCTTCLQANIDCVAVERARLPRGRAARKKNPQAERHQPVDLARRVSMLEGLLRSLLDCRAEPSLEKAPMLGGLEQIELLSQQLRHRNTTPFLAMPSKIEGSLTVLDQRLLQLYMTQVDPIFPILQCSPLWGYVTKGQPYLTFAADHPAPRALAYAISYMSIATLSDSRCSQELSLSRDLLLESYHNLAEHALEQTDYYNTNDLTVLQAFVLFLVSLQAHDRSRRFWTMLSLALRISQSLSLDKPDPPIPVTALEREMRSRLWHIISLLDVQASFDRGFAPMLPADCLRSQIFPSVDPFNYFLSLNDDSVCPIPTSLADPTFLMVMAEAQRAFRSLDVSHYSVVSIDVNSRLQTATAFQQRSQAILDWFSIVKTPSHIFLEQVANVTHLFLLMVAVHPAQPDPNLHSEECTENQNISLSLAVKFLQALKDLYENPQTETFRWYVRLFVPWRAFSVAMNQVCTCQDPSLQAYYYWLIVELYSSLQDLFSDAHQSLLQQPLQKFVALTQTCTTQALPPDSLLHLNDVV